MPVFYLIHALSMCILWPLSANRTTHLHVTKNKLIEGTSEKVNRTFFSKNNVILKIKLKLNLSAVSENTLLLIKTNIVGISWLLLHYKWWYIFSGALYNQLKYKKVLSRSKYFVSSYVNLANSKYYLSIIKD